MHAKLKTITCNVCRGVCVCVCVCVYEFKDSRIQITFIRQK